MEQVRKLPIGIQTLEKLHGENYLCVDKTALVYRVASISVPYFLSRPHRFGKNLLISTFEIYFQGRKDLLEGLAIEKLETEWKEYPVPHLDLSAERYGGKKTLEQVFSRNLSLWEGRRGKDAAEDTIASRFTGVLRRTYEQTGEQAVVLIDEYGKPLLQTILDEPLLEEYRRTPKAFCDVLKNTDRYLRSVFLAGVTKLVQVSMFSDLNQLNDIGMKPAYATVCGTTKDELVGTFTPEIDDLGEENGLTFDETVCHLTALYDGYHFEESAEGVFNPSSLLNVSDSYKFDSCWFQTDIPTYLVDLPKQSDYDLHLLIDGVEVRTSAFSEYHTEIRNPLPMIYQGGYLTIKGYDKEVSLYTLGLPNDKVHYGFLNFLILYYTEVSDAEAGFYIVKLICELRNGNVGAPMERLRVFFAGMPYELSENTERHYQAIFYVVFTLMGRSVETEVRSARGRANAIVKTEGFILVFEFKLNGTAEEALKQINEGGYLISYALDGRKLVKVGVNFSREKRSMNCYVID